jgi:hypothetical protein
MFRECSPILDMHWQDTIKQMVYPQVMDGGQILVYAGIVCQS